jgi:LPS sulfotransferase NodH
MIAASQRSGTELLCHALADTGIAGRPQEYFLAANPDELPDWRFWEEGPFGVEFGATGREHYLEIVDRLGTTDNGVFGFKLMWSNTPWAFYKFEEMPRFAGMTRSAIFHEVFPNLRGVHVTRRDRARQAVSWSRMEQDGVYIVTDDRPAQPLTTPQYDFELIKAMEQIIINGETGWREFYADLGIAPFEIVYEDLIADYEATLRALLDFLGLDASIHIPAPRTHKQADALNDAWLDRYRREIANT